MIQTPPSEERDGDVGLYVVLAALWIVPGLVFALAALLAGGAPHTHVVDWPYYAIRSVSRGHGQLAPWQWVGAATIRTPALFWAVVVVVTVPLLAVILAGTVVLRGGIPAVFPFLSQPRLRSRWSGIFTGDQAYFVRAESFRAVGGFAEIVLMEDIEIVTRLRKVGRLVLLPHYVTTSARRHMQNGLVRTVLFMWYLRTLYRLGIPPGQLQRKYVDVR